MPFVLPLIWYIPYYLFFNLVFLIPMSLLIFIFQLILVFFFKYCLYRSMTSSLLLISFKYYRLRKNINKFI
ncbi:hypothetical protein ECD93_16915 [Acinetobacter baumannii]|nr:hypothetical protein [Acinetobacter baumannii]